MSLELTLACSQYDRTLPLQDGTVVPEGLRLQFVPFKNHGDLFRRQARDAEFDVAEFSFATYSILHSRGDRRFIAIPVFPSRKFRHSEIWISRAAGIQRPADLRGKRVGTMEYQQTACVWIRGILQHDYGVPPQDIEWFFGGYNAPENYTERIPVDLPPGVRARTIPTDRSLDELLANGEIDALMGPIEPASFLRGHPNVARLFPNFQSVELDYYRRTRILPIMHTVVIRREIYEQTPWVAVSLYKAFAEAKAKALHRLAIVGVLWASLPWLPQHVAETRELLGPDPFAYGLAANRHVLDTLLQYNWEQGLLARPLAAPELFAPETHEPPDFREL